MLVAFLKMSYSNVCKLLLLTFVSDYLCIDSKTVTNLPKRCVVSFSFPHESIRTACDGTNNFHIYQSLKSDESSLMTLKRGVNAINIHLTYKIRDLTKCRRATGIPEKQQPKGFPKLLDVNITESKPIICDDGLLLKIKMLMTRLVRQIIKTDKGTEKLYTRQLARIMKNVVREELATFRKDLSFCRLQFELSEKIEQCHMRPSNFAVVVGQKTLLKNRSVFSSNEQWHADRAFGKSIHGVNGIRKINKRSLSKNIENSDYMKKKFEQIEHDIDTLANGISTLHDNMFESRDIKKQFVQEKVRMENSILEKLRSEYHDLDIKNVYISNELKTLSDMLQSTMKSQRDLQARVQNFNATFKLKIHKVEMELNALNDSDVKKSKAIEDIVTFMSTFRDILPTLIKNVTAVRNTEDDLLSKLNRTLEKYWKRKLDSDLQYVLGQETSGASFRYFILFYIQIVTVWIFLYAVSSV